MGCLLWTPNRRIIGLKIRIRCQISLLLASCGDDLHVLPEVTHITRTGSGVDARRGRDVAGVSRPLGVEAPFVAPDDGSLFRKPFLPGKHRAERRNKVPPIVKFRKFRAARSREGATRSLGYGRQGLCCLGFGDGSVREGRFVVEGLDAERGQGVVREEGILWGVKSRVDCPYMVIMGVESRVKGAVRGVGYTHGGMAKNFPGEHAEG